MSMCVKKTKENIIVIVIGLVFVALGLILAYQLPEENHIMMRFAGMVSGIGCGISLVSVVSLIRRKRSTPEQLKQQEIEKNDERNIRIRLEAAAVTTGASYFILIAMAMIFMYMGEFVITCITIGAMYLEVFIFFIARRIIEKRM